MSFFNRRGDNASAASLAIATMLVFAVTSVGSAHAQQRSEAGLRIDRAAATELSPRGALKDYQRVAILDIRLKYEAWRVLGARLTSARRVASVAPKVFARQGGPWEVTLLGTRPLRKFYVFDPGAVEVHPQNADEHPRWIAADGIVDWRLVVPLYADGQPLSVRGIHIVDRRNGETVLREQIRKR